MIASRAHARGVTLLESVCGVVLVGMIAATVAAVSSSVTRSVARQQDMLAAAELANRLMIIYVDDSDDMPSETAPVAYGERRFRWSLEKRSIKIEPGEKLREFESSRTRQPITLDRQIHAATIKVWLSEESGGAFEPQPGVPAVTVARLVNPLSLTNPDATERQFSEPGAVERIMNELINQMGNQGGDGSGGGAGGGGRP